MVASATPSTRHGRAGSAENAPTEAEIIRNVLNFPAEFSERGKVEAGASRLVPQSTRSPEGRGNWPQFEPSWCASHPRSAFHIFSIRRPYFIYFASSPNSRAAEKSAYL